MRATNKKPSALTKGRAQSVWDQKCVVLLPAMNQFYHQKRWLLDVCLVFSLDCMHGNSQLWVLSPFLRAFVVLWSAAKLKTICPVRISVTH